MERVAGFVELFTQKVPAVRVGHKKSALIDSEKAENLASCVDFRLIQNLSMFIFITPILL